jgi:DNA-binding transcriptional ArsR family regulator
LLQALLQGPLTVTELVDAIGMKQGNVSKQLGILYDTQLVARDRQGNFVRYAIADDTVSQLCALVCRKIEKDALARIAAFKGVPLVSSNRNSERS